MVLTCVSTILPDLRLNVGIIFQDYLRYQMSFAQNIAVGKIDEKENRPLIEIIGQAKFG